MLFDLLIQWTLQFNSELAAQLFHLRESVLSILLILVDQQFMLG